MMRPLLAAGLLLLLALGVPTPAEAQKTVTNMNAFLKPVAKNSKWLFYQLRVVVLSGKG